MEITKVGKYLFVNQKPPFVNWETKSLITGVLLSIILKILIMKTNLLLLFLVIFSLGKAQVTFSENFDAATPDLTGWVLPLRNDQKSYSCRRKRWRKIL
jgi:hypothetical protein